MASRRPFIIASLDDEADAFKAIFMGSGELPVFFKPAYAAHVGKWVLGADSLATRISPTPITEASYWGNTLFDGQFRMP